MMEIPRDIVARLTLLKDVASASNAAAGPEEALRTALTCICRFTGWPVGHVYLANPENPRELMPTDIWCPSDPAKFAVFREVTSRTVFNPGIGLPGRVLSSRRPAWIPDVYQDDNFIRTRIEQDIGLKSGFAFPVLVRGGVHAVLEFFFPEVIEPDETFLGLIAEIGLQLGYVIERKQAEKEKEALIKSLHQARAELTVLNAELEARVRERTAALERANLELEKEAQVRQRAEESLRVSEEKLWAMSEASHDAIVMIDARDTIVFWNHSAEKMFGRSKGEVLGRKLHGLISIEADHEKLRLDFEAFGQTGRCRFMDNLYEFMARRKNGREFPVELSLATFKLADQWYAVGGIRDITDRKEAEGRLKELAIKDGLTDLFNRRHFLELARQEIERARRYEKNFSLIILDVDHFKEINDRHGHDAGDEVLKALARVSRRILRRVDVIGRLGGEEFAVAMPETDRDQAGRTAERLRLAIARESVPLGDSNLTVTISLGVASLSHRDLSLKDLLKKADQAMYRAKDQGRNRVELE
ncbi:MAG: diguanylate cyclase [Thermodesulfobacteriota bacterium]